DDDTALALERTLKPRRQSRGGRSIHDRGPLVDDALARHVQNGEMRMPACPVERDSALGVDIARGKLRLDELEAAAQPELGKMRLAGDRIADRLGLDVHEIGNPDLSGAVLDISGEIDLLEQRVVDLLGNRRENGEYGCARFRFLAGHDG